MHLCERKTNDSGYNVSEQAVDTTLPSLYCLKPDLNRRHQHKQGVNTKIFINHIK